MKYRLRDKGCQEALKVAFPWFEEALQRDCRKQWEDGYNAISVNSDNIGIRITFPKVDIEPYNDYNPHEWNTCPETTPPENVWMRVEDEYGRGYKSFWSNGKWSRDSYVSDMVLDVARFRPWVDPDEEE